MAPLVSSDMMRMDFGPCSCSTRDPGSKNVTSKPGRCAASQVSRSPSGCTYQNRFCASLNRMPSMNIPPSAVQAIA